MLKSSTKSQKKQKTVRTTFSVPAGDHDELERIAKKKNVSVSWVVREAIRQYLASRSPLFPDVDT